MSRRCHWAAGVPSCYARPPAGLPQWPWWTALWQPSGPRLGSGMASCLTLTLTLTLTRGRGRGRCCRPHPLSVRWWWWRCWWTRSWSASLMTRRPCVCMCWPRCGPRRCNRYWARCCSSWGASCRLCCWLPRL
ncbi:hypothetical protein V8C86DRAFT_2625746 [Haematococcus lacustris]